MSAGRGGAAARARAQPSARRCEYLRPWGPAMRPACAQAVAKELAAAPLLPRAACGALPSCWLRPRPPQVLAPAEKHAVTAPLLLACCRPAGGLRGRSRSLAARPARPLQAAARSQDTHHGYGLLLTLPPRLERGRAEAARHPLAGRSAACLPPAPPLARGRHEAGGAVESGERSLIRRLRPGGRRPQQGTVRRAAADR